MKFIATTLYCFLLILSHGQIKSLPPVLENVSRQDISLIEALQPGQKIVFNQQCNPNLPEIVVNGIVQFEGMHVAKNEVLASIEFKDTIIQRVIFEFRKSNIDALNFFKVPMNGFTELSKKNHYQSYIADGYEYTCFINRKKVTLVKTLMKAR